jgi:hypothetical protein
MDGGPGEGQAFELSCQNVLERLLVQRQVRHKSLQAMVLLLKLSETADLSNTQTSKLLLPPIEGLLRYAHLRTISAIGTPLAAGRSTKAIWFSVHRFLMIRSSFPECAKLTSEMDQDLGSRTGWSRNDIALGPDQRGEVRGSICQKPDKFPALSTPPARQALPDGPESAGLSSSTSLPPREQSNMIPAS